MLGNRKPTSKFMILLEFSNLTFDSRIDIEWVSNAKFIPLVRETPRRFFQLPAMNPSPINTGGECQ